MKFWILKDKNPDFGRMIGIIVRASSEKDARRLANTKAYGEGLIWDNEYLTSCQELLADDKEEVILNAVAE